MFTLVFPIIHQWFIHFLELVFNGYFPEICTVWFQTSHHPFSVLLFSSLLCLSPPSSPLFHSLSFLSHLVSSPFLCSSRLTVSSPSSPPFFLSPLIFSPFFFLLFFFLVSSSRLFHYTHFPPPVLSPSLQTQRTPVDIKRSVNVGPLNAHTHTHRSLKHHNIMARAHIHIFKHTQTQTHCRSSSSVLH